MTMSLLLVLVMLLNTDTDNDNEDDANDGIETDDDIMIMKFNDQDIEGNFLEIKTILVHQLVNLMHLFSVSGCTKKKLTLGKYDS